MIQWTSITHTHTVEGVDLTTCEVYVSYSQHPVTITVPADEVVYYENDPEHGACSKVMVHLTQGQTGAFKNGQVGCQINWLTHDGKRDAVKVKTYEMYKNLIPKVLE